MRALLTSVAKKVENAIEIAFNPTSDPSLKSQALQFLDQLRSEPQIWQVCLSFVVREPQPSEVVRHVALDIINDAIRGGQLDPLNLAVLRDNLMMHVQKVYGANGISSLQIDPPNIQNKISQTLTYLFKLLYSTDWSSFFHDMLGLTVTAGSVARDNAPGVRFYLRILNSVHDEIADILVPKSTGEQRKDTDLKDLVRQRDAKMIVLSWQEILSQWRLKDDFIVAQCLAVIKRWVAWTDISLVIDAPILNILFELVSPPRTANEPNSMFITTETFVEIIGKKMGADDKLELISILRIKEVVSQLIQSAPLLDQRFTPLYDTDVAESAAKLVNTTVSDIVRALESAQDGTSLSIRAMNQLNEFLPYVLRFFSDEYDEICSTVIPCMTDLLTLFRRKAKAESAFYSENASILPSMLDAVIAKMKYDETSSWGNEDAQADEAEFQDLRKRLQVLQQAIAAVNKDLYIDSISKLIIGTFDKYHSLGGQVDWRDVELAMHELFLFGELALKGSGLYSKTKPVSTAAERLIEMMAKLINSNIASFSHPAIQLQFMEVCVRYTTFFEANPQLIAPVLEKFVQFVHDNHVKVQTRSWYLFHRFVKHVRQHMGNISETVIQALGDLLVIKAELPAAGSDDGDMSSDENEHNEDTRFTSQLYLYEAVGGICSAHAIAVDNQVLYVKSVIIPLCSELEAYLIRAKARDERAIVQVHHLIMALGTLAKGFSEWHPAQTSTSGSPPAKAISDEFTKAAEAIIIALETLNSSSDIRTAARFAFSRFVGVLGNGILLQLPRWINGLLSQTSTKEEMALFLRLLDQTVFGFKLEILEILNSLLTPLLQRVFAGIGEPVNGTDDALQLAELKREYLNFLLIILNNNLESVLVSEVNQPSFDAVLTTNEHLAKDIGDLPTARLAFIVLSRMVMTWGGPDVVSQPLSQGNGVVAEARPQPSLPGFDRFMMTRFSPLSWAIPSNSNFNSKDAQGKQVLGEAAGLQKAIHAKTGQEYLTWLREVELREMGMDSGTIEEYLRALCDLDVKGFRHFFQTLVQRSRSS